LAGEAAVGTISCMARDGRLVHRRAEFSPLFVSQTGKGKATSTSGGVLVLLADRDLSPQELAADVSADQSPDELHRIIRRYRRAQENRYSLESLLGSSSAMQKVRAQVAAAAASGSNVVIYGRPGSGRGHIARAIHYQAGGDPPPRLVPLDGEVANDDSLRRAIDAVRQAAHARQRVTLLLENLDRLAGTYQSQLLEVVRQNASVRVVATYSWRIEGESRRRGEGEWPTDALNSPPLPLSHSPTLDPRRCDTIDPSLLDAISTITIRVPPLVERLEDLPLLAQYFLEACNRESTEQVGSIRADALDLLALYGWPNELAELRDVIVAAHQACKSHQVVPADLPAVIHHASQAASRIRRKPERIVLDVLLANIEREAIVRAMAQAAGNKTEAADLLGMTRPRLYRRLVQLGLVVESATDGEAESPEFIERVDDEA
jgi:DNA-binding NtrC family response regulator